MKTTFWFDKEGQWRPRTSSEKPVAPSRYLSIGVGFAGLTPAAITQALDSLSNGRKVSQIVDGNRRFDVVMRLSEQDRSTTGLQNLLIPTGLEFVPLSALAEVVETDGPNQIQREGTQRRIVVYGNGDGRRDIADIAADIQRAVSQLGFPQGYTTNLEGAFQAQQEASWRIGIISLASLAMIFIVLYSRYRSTALSLITAFPWP